VARNKFPHEKVARKPQHYKGWAGLLYSGAAGAIPSVLPLDLVFFHFI